MRANVNHSLISLHRQKLLEFASELQLKGLDDWYQVSRSQVYDKLPFIQRNYSNLFTALKTVFPEHPWDASKFTLHPKMYWSDERNQRRALEEVATQLNIKTLDDWYKANRTDLYAVLPFLRKQTLFQCLKTLYPHHHWDESKFVVTSKDYWKNINNQRRRLDEIAKELNINQLDDWYKVTRSEVYKRMPSLQHFHKSLYFALKAIYPEHEWDEHKFNRVSTYFWNDVNNQKKRMDSIAKELNINHPDEWYRLSSSQIRSKMLFVSKYGNLFNALKSLYPQHSWNALKLNVVPSTMWNRSNEHMFRDVLIELMNKHGVSSYEDWMKLPPHDLKIFHKISRNMYSNTKQMLSTLIPEVNWSTQAQSKPEMILQDMLKKVTQIEVHANIDGFSVDVYIPQWSVAIEYQGSQHYMQTHRGEVSQQIERDVLKEKQLERLGISLIKIPYWWNLSWNQLYTALKSKKPGDFLFKFVK